MSKWLNSFLQKRGHFGPDKRGSLSAVSGPTKGHFLEIEKNGATTVLTELTRGHQSGLSVPPEGLFPLDRDSLLYGFEERVAIAEVDGNQNPIQAHRIAYLDAFISLLSALAENDPHQSWLAQKIQTALATLEAQNFPTLN